MFMKGRNVILKFKIKWGLVNIILDHIELGP